MKVIIEQEYIKRKETEFCERQFNEAFDEARDVLIDNDLYTEGFGNSILNKIKSGLQKVCPSPEKIKDFMAKYEKRIDDKLKGCKEKWFVDAWNNLKNLAKNIDNKKANESFAMYLESIGEDLNSREYDYSYLTDESLYEEGFFDKLKNGVKAGIDAFKNSGNDEQQQKNSQGQDDKNNNNQNQNKNQNKANTKKQSSNNKPTKLGQMIQQNGWSQEDALKPENVKKIAAALKKSGKSVPDMVKKYFASNPQQNTSKNVKTGDGKTGDAKNTGKIDGKAILQFMKKHWKMIAIILIAAIGFMWGGPMVGAKFLVGPTIRQACKLVGGHTGTLLGTVGAVGATMAMGDIGGDDVDAGDVDSDSDVDSGSSDSDDAEADREAEEMEDEYEYGGNLSDMVKQNPKDMKQFRAIMNNVNSNDKIQGIIQQMHEKGLSGEEIQSKMFKSIFPNGVKNTGLNQQAKSIIRLSVLKAIGKIQ